MWLLAVVVKQNRLDVTFWSVFHKIMTNDSVLVATWFLLIRYECCHKLLLWYVYNTHPHTFYLHYDSLVRDNAVS